MRYAVCLCGLALVAALVGCSPAIGRGGQPSAEVATVDPSADANLTVPGAYRLIVAARAAVVEVPLGASSCSEEIWSYVDEEPVEAVRSAGLGRNGLRVGLARAETWPDLEDVLRRLTGRDAAYAVLTAAAGEPVSLLVKRRQSPATIFAFYPDGSASGADYPAGDYLITITCLVKQDDPSRLVLTALPQIRASAIETDVGQTPLGVGFRSSREMYSFDQVAMQLTMPAGDILVIGPGAESLRPNSIAHHFLTDEKKGVPFETVILLIPEVIAAPIK